MLTFNGKPFNADGFQQALERQMVEQVVSQVRQRFATIRHPRTGEFPVLYAVGETLQELTMRLEASPELIEIVRQQTPREDLNVQLLPKGGTPRVFLSYAFEDKQLAERIAHTLQAQGIDTWWAGWCMAAGDSLRQKIDQGLAGCTHFVVLLTRTSIEKPWVKQEMDAGLVRALNAQAVFIPLRYQLSARELPPLLSGVLSPEVNAAGDDLQQLVNDIYGVTKKPQLGPPPATAQKASAGSSRYSAAALSVAEMLVRRSTHGLFHDPQLSRTALAEATGLSGDDVMDALHELGPLIQDEPRYEGVWPRAALFAELDAQFMPWNPAEDALQLAADLVNDAAFPTEPAQIASRYGWAARRLNPAIAWLSARDLVRTHEGLSTGGWIAFSVEKTDATRRFLKSRSGPGASPPAISSSPST